MYKHYIRINEQNEIIEGYCLQIKPYLYQEGDICIYEGDEYRQFFLIDNIINPNLTSGIGDNTKYNYKYIDGKVVEV
jgi:hypothetical protein